MSNSINYRPEIDGLRAVAVLPVIIFHLGLSFIPGGFVGVDVFFVISGFLITSIILSEESKGRFTLKSFWVRRVRRIMPVLLAAVGVTMLVTLVFGYRNELFSIGQHALAAIFSVANIVIWKSSGDYWGGAAESSPFLHCWSLAVEEQFYIFYPVLLYFLLRWRRAFVVPLVILACLASLALFIYATKYNAVAGFYLLPMRAWELGMGCLVALTALNRKVGRTGGGILAAIGLLLIVGGYFFIRSSGITPLMVIPVIGASLFIAFGVADRGAGRLLANPGCVFIGKISYSLYIWHWPVIVLSRHLGLVDPHGSPLSVLVQGAVIFGLAMLSYHFIEVPFRKPQVRLVPIGAGFAGVASLAVALVILNPTQAYDVSMYSRVKFDARHYDVTPALEEVSGPGTPRMAGVEWRKRDAEWAEAYAQGGIIKKYGGDVPRLMVIGDSHATMWSDVVASICDELDVTASFFGAIGTSPFVHLPLEFPNDGKRFTAQQRFAFDNARLEAIKKWRPVVVLATRWMSYKEEDVSDLLKYIGDTGCRVLLIEQPPEIEIGDRNSAQYLAYLGYDPVAGENLYMPQHNETEVNRGRTLVRQLASKYNFCSVVPVHDLYIRGQHDALVLSGNDIIYYDDDHLTDAGARKAETVLKASIAQALATNRL